MPRDTASRCGYRLEFGLDHDALSADPCDRPTWEDHERCIWHAPVDGKTMDMLEDYRPEPDERLDGAYLRKATLVGIDWFAGTSLIGADLTAANVNNSDFSNTNFMLATLADVSAINASFDQANLEGSTFTNADLRRSSLQDARFDEVVLTNVHIGPKTTFGEKNIYEQGDAAPELSRDHPLEASAWAYRQLQQVYQENSLPQLAQQSYNQEKDARRRLAWTQRRYIRAIKWEVSRFLMKYGSSPFRVLGVSLVVIVVSAILFPLTGGIQEIQGDRVITYAVEDPSQAPQWWIGRVLLKSLYFSVVTFATLGYGDIQPIGMWSRVLASVETILGSLLSALLVFVLARNVTW